MNRYFFEQTNSLHDEIVALHDFVLPTSTALWHFRGVIEQELRTDPSITVAALSKKYNVAPQTRGTTNLKTPFRSRTWERQRERLAEVALVGVIAVYEIWCEQICECFGTPHLAIKLQFPSGPTNSNGIRFAIGEMSATSSPILRRSIYPALTGSKKYSLATLDNLLKCFRYFKELRNSMLHRGRVCDGKLYGAQSEFTPVATKACLGMDFVPVHNIYRMHEAVALDLHGVLGFTEVILRIITTVDAELCATLPGEVTLAARIRELGPTPIPSRKLAKVFDTLGWKGTLVTQDLIALLQDQRIVTRT